MNKAELYCKSNNLTRFDSQQLINEFNKKFKWRTDASDSLLDAGCGPGDVTKDIIKPILPDTFQRLVGVDISEEMINYARKTQIHPKLSFELFDLNVALEEQPLNGIEPFDHITSFYCLMWVQNQKTCLENLFKLLKPGGDMLLAFLINHVVFDAYIQQSQDELWAKYTNDCIQTILPYHNSEHPATTFSGLLTECGFIDCEVRVDDKLFTFDGAGIRDFFHSVNPFIDRIPPDKQKNYLDDLLGYFRKYVCGDINEDIVKCKFNLPYKMLVAYARKSTDFVQ